jgi:glycogen operon protein
VRPLRIETGSPQPLGARWTGDAVNVAISCGHAAAVELCLFEEPLGAGETARIALPGRTGATWHARLPDLRPGQLYGLRVQGDFDPAAGRRCNPSKLLVDPWARALTSGFVWDEACFGHVGGRRADAAADLRDSAPFVPKGVVVDERFDWQDDRHPRVPWSETLIYECHVRGMTLRHPQVPEGLRGRYLGLVSPPIIEHLHALGVTAVELLPVQHFLSERAAVRRGLVNYWGYNPIGLCAPHPGYASGDRGQQVREFKQMVRALHAAGLEVILDVVFNHTAEGDQRGPTLSLRGLDQAAYYRHRPSDPRRDVDHSGCGNSLNAASEAGRRLILDALRTWVNDLHVDGFRFDMAPVLGRDARGEHDAALWEQLLADPVLGRVKLIAEAWDLGPDGWRVGRFPRGWREWNDRFRDGVRRYWAGEKGRSADLVARITGSADLFPDRPLASVNYVACHDGFTLADLVAYQRKHNHANGQRNRDGDDANWSRNWGVEGPTSDPRIVELRAKVQRSLLATALLARGVPMLAAGDESGRTQRGNNNPWCQDNELGWLDWDLDAASQELLAFARRVVSVRRRWIAPWEAPGEPSAWIGLDPEGCPRTGPHDDALVALLREEPPERSGAGSAALLLALNAGDADREQRLPDQGPWTVLIDSARPLSPEAASDRMVVPAHALLLLLRHVDRPGEEPTSSGKP